MKLLHGGLSPFVRKVMVVAHEKGVADALERVPSPVNPLEPMESVIAVNPLGKIPALVLDQGDVLYGSTLICEYLDDTFPEPRMVPVGPARWEALRRCNLADGVLEAGNLIRIESLRPEGTQWEKWEEVQTLKVANALDALEQEASGLSSDAPQIGDVAIGCALGWLDVRLQHIAWRKDRPSLESWYQRMADRPSMVSTAPNMPR